MKRAISELRNNLDLIGETSRIMQTDIIVELMANKGKLENRRSGELENVLTR